jgi:hypothetical protein
MLNVFGIERCIFVSINKKIGFVFFGKKKVMFANS